MKLLEKIDKNKVPRRVMRCDDLIFLQSNQKSYNGKRATCRYGLILLLQVPFQKSIITAYV